VSKNHDVSKRSRKDPARRRPGLPPRFVLSAVADATPIIRTAVTCLATIMTIAGLRAEAAEAAKAEERVEAEEKKGKKKRARNSEVVQQPLDKDWQIPESKEKFHVFLLYGQSNMAGGIKKHQPGYLLPEDKIPTPHLLQVRSGRPISVSGGWFPAVHPLHVRPGRPNSFGLGIPFAKESLREAAGLRQCHTVRSGGPT